MAVALRIIGASFFSRLALVLEQVVLIGTTRAGGLSIDKVILEAVGVLSMAMFVGQEVAIVALETGKTILGKINTPGNILDAFASRKDEALFAGLAVTLRVIGNAVGGSLHTDIVIDEPSFFTVVAALPDVGPAVRNHTGL